MENKIKEYALSWKGTKKENLKSISLIRYADDFVLLHKDKQIVENCQEIIKKELLEIGLKLNEEKTKILDTRQGFDFLGFNIRQYPCGKHQTGKNPHGELLRFKTIIKPSKEKVIQHYNNLKNIVDKHKAATQQRLVSKLTPIIRGWSNYYSSCCSKETFSKIDHLLFLKLYSWAKRRHPNKNKHWIKDKYWHTIDNNNWRFTTEDKKYILHLHSRTPIKRHIKVKNEASIYDGELIYWATRRGKHPETKPQVARLLKQQKGKCNYCKLTFKSEDKIEIDHITPSKAGGNNSTENLQLLHKHCHDGKTKDDFLLIKKYKILDEWRRNQQKIQKTI
ncbi:reverse transcriptase homolog [Chondrocystis sp. NIES-4102]|nr:reverse transcriptase homolog [Chondrocystis sp. NIES-4102]